MKKRPQFKPTSKKDLEKASKICTLLKATTKEAGFSYDNLVEMTKEERREYRTHVIINKYAKTP